MFKCSNVQGFKCSNVREFQVSSLASLSSLQLGSCFRNRQSQHLG